MSKQRPQWTDLLHRVLVEFNHRVCVVFHIKSILRLWSHLTKLNPIKRLFIGDCVKLHVIVEHLFSVVCLTKVDVKTCVEIHTFVKT